MAEAFYRKYRSKSLDEVIGQSHITDTLARALSNGKISHAYLFTGPRGVGKTSVARILAHAVNNMPYNDESTHLDIIEIDAASNRRIDDIRDLREKVHVAPVEAPYKVYIIDEVHMLTGESFNALLKTLEEPPSHVIFILATTESHKLPATIISRTQRFNFRPVAVTAITKHLQSIAKAEGIKAEPAALELIAEHGDGSFRDSISLLDQLAALTGGDITLDLAEKVIGISPNSAIEKIIQYLNSGETGSLQKVLSEQLDERGVNAQVITWQLVKALKSAAHDNPAFYELIDSLLEVPKSSQPALKLTVTLLKFASNSGEPPKTSKAANVHKTTFHTVSKTPREVNAAKASAKPVPASKAAVESKNTSGAADKPFDLFAWPDVLTAVKKTNPPLHSVLSKASPRLKGSELILAFGYKLHQKKLEDPKYRTKLARVIADLGYDSPQITALVDRAGTPPQKSSPAAKPEESDETTRSVLDMMGGGEIVET